MTVIPLLRAALLVAVLGGCAGAIDLPPAGPTDGGRTPGAIIWHDLISDTPQQTRRFYSELFGWTFEAVPGMNYELIRHSGRLVGGMVDQNQLPARVDVSQWVVAMAVADIEAATAAAAASGGQVLTPPTSLGSRGTISVIVDNSGALLALLQSAQGDPLDDPGQTVSGQFLWNELWVPDPAPATQFYQSFTPLDVRTASLEGVTGKVEYRLLQSHGKPRAGIRSVPVEGMPPMWVSYLRVADEAELETLLQRVAPLGGEVVVPATRRPGGGSIAVILGPSGAGIALQTWPLQTLDASAGDLL